LRVGDGKPASKTVKSFPASIQEMSNRPFLQGLQDKYRNADTPVDISREADNQRYWKEIDEKETA